MKKDDMLIIPSWPAKLDGNLLHYGFCALDPKNPTRRLELGEGRVEFVAMADPDDGGEPAVPNHVDHRCLVSLLSLAMARPKVDGKWNRTVSGMTVGRFLRLAGDGTKPTPGQYARFSETLRRYMNIQIRFHGSFREGTGKTVRRTKRVFHVLDSYEVVRGSGKGFTVTFNEDFMNMLRDSKYYRWVSGREYALMTSPVAIRLFEILEKSFMAAGRGEDHPAVRFDAADLACLIPVRDAYPSQVKRRVEAAFPQVEKATKGRYSMTVSSGRGTVVFDFVMDRALAYRPFSRGKLPAQAMPFEDDVAANVVFRLKKLVDIGSRRGLALADSWTDYCRENGYRDLNDAMGDAAFRVARMDDGTLAPDMEQELYLDLLSDYLRFIDNEQGGGSGA